MPLYFPLITRLRCLTFFLLVLGLLTVVLLVLGLFCNLCAHSVYNGLLFDF